LGVGEPQYWQLGLPVLFLTISFLTMRELKRLLTAVLRSLPIYREGLGEAKKKGGK
jgi:hypothetical protein